MKILCLSDLHRRYRKRNSLMDQQDTWIHNLCIDNDPDVILITGDVFESSLKASPYRLLNEMFDGRPVICTLGNHEFFYRKVDDVIKRYQDEYNPDKYNVHYLDVVNSYDIDFVHFFGNVLWYDGSMCTLKCQEIDNFALYGWKDSTIEDFDFRSLCIQCVDKICNDKRSNEKVNILCTHHIPHIKLNGHIRGNIGLNSPYNAYSGVNDLLQHVENCDYAICGHTHSRVVGIQIGQTYGINVGCDYYPAFFRSFVLEINPKETTKQ